MIKKALGVESGSKTPNRDKVGGVLTKAQIDEIVKKKFPDMNVRSRDSAKRMVRGSARSMGVDCELEEA